MREDAWNETNLRLDGREMKGADVHLELLLTQVLLDFVRLVKQVGLQTPVQGNERQREDADEGRESRRKEAGNDVLMKDLNSQVVCSLHSLVPNCKRRVSRSAYVCHIVSSERMGMREREKLVKN